MVSLPISGVVQRESGTFFVSRPHNKSTLLFHLKYYKMKENTFESSLSAEAKNRELPIDPELKEILLLVNEAHQRFEVFFNKQKEKETIIFNTYNLDFVDTSNCLIEARNNMALFLKDILLERLDV